ncbi:hypothetical protein RIF29_19256 [Crotalaria pallida]|uniref:Uncharacterized protein n=1 Tax=Crotalaria pallida TaxID=3830 RepID=A0AAN9EZN5_CROPI
MRGQHPVFKSQSMKVMVEEAYQKSIQRSKRVGLVLSGVPEREFHAPGRESHAPGRVKCAETGAFAPGHMFCAPGRASA